jgi:signal transduction histidine kinase
LKGAIKDFCKKYAHPRFTIQAEIYGFEEKLDKYLEVAIYRIAQELVNNVIKHAEASRLHLHLVKGDNGILLRVTDNGKGFNSSRVMQDLRGIGLKTIHDRIKLLNGSIEVDSKPGKGTAVSIIIPPT